MDFSELYLTYYSKLVRFAKEFVILEEDAENITQDVFTDLWAKRDSMDRIENMNAYLFRLIKNRCLDHLKHKMFEQKYIEFVQTSFEIEMSLKLQSLDRFDVSDISEGNETEILVRNAINSLPRKCRDIFLLSRVEGLKYREISERLGISVNTVECQMGIYNPQIQISVVSGTKRSIFRQKNKTKRSKKRLHTTLIKPEQKVNEDLCSGFIVS